MSDELDLFMRESLRIEGIFRDPTDAEIEATTVFIAKPKLEVRDVVDLVAVYAPGHVLRDRPGLNVRVGNHIAPLGGPDIENALAFLLDRVSRRAASPWHLHVEYETLHPFTDGNGRSGRAVWLWQHQGYAPLGFLHQFYYETLSSSADRKA